MLRLILIWFVFCSQSVVAQTLGGNAVFTFLKLPNTPQLTALGGVHISGQANDIGLAINNPGLLRPAMHSQVNAVFNDFYAGVKVYGLALGYHHARSSTTFAMGMHYLDYGDVPETDASGNTWGTFRPRDLALQVSAAHAYRGKWNGGITLKYIHSSYGAFRSSGLATDLGLVYHDTSSLFSAAILVRNLGFQVKPYPGTAADDLPFDLQLGITKRLSGAPFSFSLTTQQMHRFNILYNDTTFNNENGWSRTSSKKFSMEKLLRHFVLGTTIYFGDHVEIMAGYNFLRRKELNAGNAGNGMNGFSMGAGLLIGKLQVRYARAYYQRNLANNQFGISLQLNQYLPLGKFGKRIGW